MDFISFIQKINLKMQDSSHVEYIFIDLVSLCCSRLSINPTRKQRMKTHRQTKSSKLGQVFSPGDISLLHQRLVILA